MNTDMTEEYLSALIDAEITAQQAGEITDMLCKKNNIQSTWQIYQQIGYLLRISEKEWVPSVHFTSRLHARLAVEPAFSSCAANEKAAKAETITTAKEVLLLADLQNKKSNRFGRFIGFSGAALAAILALFNFITPSSFVMTTALMATPKQNITALLVQAMPDLPANKENQAILASADARSIILRNQRIDDYLLAHQHFSPSLYSTAQYVRLATFSEGTPK